MNPTLYSLDPYTEATISFRDCPVWDNFDLPETHSPIPFMDAVEEVLAQLEFPLRVLSWDSPTEATLYFTSLKSYVTRDDAIQREILDCLPDPEFDIEAIADELIFCQQTPSGPRYCADPYLNGEAFWELCLKHVL